MTHSERVKRAAEEAATAATGWLLPEDERLDAADYIGLSGKIKEVLLNHFPADPQVEELSAKLSEIWKLCGGFEGEQQDSTAENVVALVRHEMDRLKKLLVENNEMAIQCEQMAEQHNMELAAISTASIQNTETTRVSAQEGDGRVSKG